MKIMEKMKNKLQEPMLAQKVWYMVLFAALCILDQLSSSAPGKVQMISTNCMGLLVAGMVAGALSWKGAGKLPYLIWTVVSAVGGCAAFWYGQTHWLYQGQWRSAVLNVVVYGYLVIRLWEQFYRQHRPLSTAKTALVLWVILMLWASCSRNRAVWPVWYLVMFGSFYLCHFTKKQWTVFIQGMLNGLVLGFCLLQGTAYLYRPYDHLRYKGIYIGETHNGLFYLLVFCALLGKWLCAGTKAGKAASFFGGSAMISFILLTMGRAPAAAAAVVGLCSLLLASRKGKYRILQFIKRGVLQVACIAVSFPLVYASVRYLPAVLQKPIWFEGEYSDKRVFPWDAKDTDKYISFEEALSGSFGRLLWFAKEDGRQRKKTMADWQDPFTLHVYAAKEPVFDKGQDASVPMMPGLASNESIAIRKQIYKFYAGHLNWTGHTNAEFRCWVTEEFYIEHAHNLFLQYGYQFGIPAGVLLVLLVVLALKDSIRQAFGIFAGGNAVWEEQVRLLFLTAILVFSMFEITWRTGQMSNVIFFLLLLTRKEEKVRTDETVERY